MSSPLLALITLPALAPLVALLNLLFPGLLGDHWRRYRIVISVLLTQSTVLFVHWILVRWVVESPGRWMSDAALNWYLFGVAAVGLVVGTGLWLSTRGTDPLAAAAPVKIEYLALGIFALSGVAWAVYQVLAAGNPLDQMLGVTIASTVGFGHLLVRQGRAPSPAPAPNTTNDPTPAPVRTSAPLLSTEVVFLLVLVACGTVYAVQSGEPGVANRQATAGSGEWTTYRGDDRRTGAVDPDDAGPVRPELLWSFDPAPRRGSVSLHSSPTVVDGLCYVGALHEVSALVQGHVYCVNVADGRKIGETTLKAGELVWRFTAEDELRPVFSSPSVRDGRVYFGEGYHQNKNCRLFCLEAGSGEKPVWVHKTASHVESCPVLVGDRIYIGAGDDGLVCLDLSATKTGGAPTVAWQTKEVHVDSSPVVAAGKVIAGGVTGDVVTTLAVIAADAETGEIAWRVPTEVPVPGCPAFLDGRVYVTLGNGKLNQAADRPTGAVLCLDVADGRQIWRHPLETSVLSTAAVGPTGVVAADTWGLVTALDPVTGSVRWRANLDDPIVASPVATKTRVFVATLSGIVHALDAATGDVVWSFAGLKTAAEDVYASPVLVGGRLYVAAGGKLHCLGDRKTP